MAISPARYRATLSEVLPILAEVGFLVRQKPIILCIDDNPSLLGFLKVLLGGEEYEVLVASSGSEGLDLYTSQPVDAVILDYQMPEMKGDRVATQMKLAKPDVPIVLHSGDECLPEDVLQSVEAFVAKGESPVTLLATVRGLLTGARHPLLTGSATGSIAPLSGARA